MIMKKTGKTTGSNWQKLSRRVMALLLAIMCISLLFSQIAAADETDVEIGQEAAAEGSDIVEEVTEPPAEDVLPEIQEETSAEQMQQEPETSEETSEEQVSEEAIPQAPEEAPAVISEQIEDIEEVVSEDTSDPVTADPVSEEPAAEPEIPETEPAAEAKTPAEETTEAAEVEEKLEDAESEELDSQNDRDVLSYGMTGEDVLKMQTALKELGYLGATPDGIFGGQSLMAVKRFQLFNALPVTGEANSETLTLLFQGNAENYRTLWRGARGKAVYNVQQYLYNAGFLPVEPDGSFGRYTEAAVKIYQAQAGLSSPDGGVGNWTTEKLLNVEVIFESLGIGNRGNAVLVLQTQLQKLGFLNVNPDGSFGGYSERAVKKFQMYAGLTMTGLADAVTLNAIYRGTVSFSTLTKGSKGTAVKNLQNILKDLGFLKVEPDGSYGNFTVQAVKDFQKANGITQDGACGRYTTEALFRDPVSASDYSKTVTVDYGGTFTIKTALGSSVLDLKDASVYDGANVQLYTGNDTGAQKWVMQSAGGEYYYIRNLRSWKVLDMVDGNVQQSVPDSSSQTQKWKIVKLEDGGFQVINANGMYLSASSDSSGSNVGGAAESTGQGEVWYFTETDAGTALDFKTDGTQYLGIRTFNISKGNVTETSGYYNIETEIDLPSGGYNLSGGSNYSIGLKVMYVNSYLANAGYLSWDYYNYNRYDGNTVWAVQQFQSDHGLSPDGVVGIQTWRAMGYSDYDWYNLGAYVTDLKVYAYGSSRDTYVNAMLSTAQEYAWAGTGFADGASGTPGTYVDCSGLIYQCLYSAGINPDTNIIDHARVVYEYTSNYLGNDWQMGVAVGSAQPGDLVFYGGNSINHVAIYAGNGMIYDSWPGQGVTLRSIYSGGNILKIVRVF